MYLWVVEDLPWDLGYVSVGSRTYRGIWGMYLWVVEDLPWDLEYVSVGSRTYRGIWGICG